MKKIVKPLILSSVALLMFIHAGCKEVKDLVPVPSMTATVDGESWTSLFRVSVLFENNDMITITGTPDYTENVDKAIILTIYGTDAGTYNLNPGTLSTNCSVVYRKTANAAEGTTDYYISKTATVTISSIDKTNKRISGTFSATLINNSSTEISITSGKFENLNYQVQ